MNWDEILRKYTYKYLAKNLSLYSYACFWNLKKKTFLNWHLLLYGGGYNIVVLRFYLITSLHKFNIIRHFSLRSLQHSAPRKEGKLVLAISIRIPTTISFYHLVTGMGYVPPEKYLPWGNHRHHPQIFIPFFSFFLTVSIESSTTFVSNGPTESLDRTYTDYFGEHTHTRTIVRDK